MITLWVHKGSMFMDTVAINSDKLNKQIPRWKKKILVNRVLGAVSQYY